MITRRSFLRLLGIGALAGPALVKAALVAPVAPEMHNFMGFKFVRTLLVEPPITAAQIRACKARGMTLDQRINSRYRQPWTWEMDKVLVGVQVDETYFERMRRAIREAWMRPLS